MDENQELNADEVSADGLYAGRMPSEAGSETSVAAASAIEKHVHRLRNQVLDAFREAGALGLTSNEVELKLGMRQSTASARVRELNLLGWLEEVGKRKTRSGRMAKVFTARPQPKPPEQTKGLEAPGSGASSDGDGAADATSGASATSGAVASGLKERAAVWDAIQQFADAHHDYEVMEARAKVEQALSALFEAGRNAPR